MANDDLVRKMLGPDFADDMARRMAEHFERSWGQQGVEERRRRLGFVVKMSIELAEVRKQTTFSSSFAEWAIEAVITGDPEDLKRWAHLLSEEDFVRNTDSKDGPRYARIYAKFREICEDAYVTSLPREKV